MARYNVHDLATQDAVALMDRMDTKYVLPEALAADCLARLTDSYTVLEMDGRRRFVYENLYFDNDALDLYRAHHNTQLNRYKVRQRRYVDADRLFMEIKLKNNRKRTIKRRLEIEPCNRGARDGVIDDFLQRCLPFSPEGLGPAIFVTYQRMTLLNHEHTERVTVDTDLRFHSLRNGRVATLPGVCVIEAKTDRKASGSAVGAALKVAGVRPLRLSKYCTGVALTETIKRNTFKPQFRRLEQITGKPVDAPAYAVN